jgi:hypothetical protein
MGGGLFLSLHYDLRFQPDQRGWGAHAGIGYVFGGYRDFYYAENDMIVTRRRHYPTKLTIPFGFNYLLGKENSPHRLELGMGATYMNGDSRMFDEKKYTTNTWLLVGTVGYRRVYLNGPLMWKVAFTPVMSLHSEYPLPWAEGSIGIRF